MARFPATEPDIAALAVVMIQGLRDNPELFPTPPVSPDMLQANLDEFNGARTAAVAAEAAARDRVAAKNQTLDQLADNMRINLTYAEVAAKDAPEQLAKPYRRACPTCRSWRLRRGRPLTPSRSTPPSTPRAPA